MYAPSQNGRCLALPVHTYAGRDPIEAHYDELNRSFPYCERNILSWGAQGQDLIRLASLSMSALPPMAANDFGPSKGGFMAEAEYGFGLSVRTSQLNPSPTAYAVCLVLAGTMTMERIDGIFAVGAGEGLIIDPAAVVELKISPGTHFVEFNLSRRHLMRLGGELAPGSYGRELQLSPVLRVQDARNLAALSSAMAGMIGPGSHAAGQGLLFQRWSEIIALTVLQQQQALPAAISPPQEAGSPASLRRALEYIESQAESDIALVDIAAAAYVSASTLLRLFRTHLNMSPMAFLRQLRLDRARVELRSDRARTVQETAQRWNFQNASKFSRAYAERFGELPSDTRLRRR